MKDLFRYADDKAEHRQLSRIVALVLALAWIAIAIVIHTSVLAPLDKKIYSNVDQTMLSDISDRLSWTKWLLSVSIVILGFSASAVGWAAWEFVVRNRAINENLSKIGGHLENLDNRHNIIQSGTEYGRVLALRDFTNRDLTAGTKYFNGMLGEGTYSVVSTLIVDRAEELLTSEQYMNFLVNLSLPEKGYFRLIIARRPKQWDGLSAYGVISDKLGYRTAVIPSLCWGNTLRPTLRSLLREQDYNGLVQLVERNTELAVKNVSLQDLAETRVPGTDYAGRIAKLKNQITREEPATIWEFSHKDHSKVLPVIKPTAVELYCRLLAIFSQGPAVMTEFNTSAFEAHFDGSLNTRLTIALKEFFGRR